MVGSGQTKDWHLPSQVCLLLIQWKMVIGICFAVQQGFDQSSITLDNCEAKWWPSQSVPVCDLPQHAVMQKPCDQKATSALSTRWFYLESLLTWQRSTSVFIIMFMFVWGLSKIPLTFWYVRTPCAVLRAWGFQHILSISIVSCSQNPICHEDVIESPGFLINPYITSCHSVLPWKGKKHPPQTLWTVPGSSAGSISVWKPDTRPSIGCKPGTPSKCLWWRLRRKR